MGQSNLLLQKPKSYLRFGILVFLILVAAKFVINDALPYFGVDKENFGDYWDYKWPLIGHISGGLLALTVGPFNSGKDLE